MPRSLDTLPAAKACSVCKTVKPREQFNVVTQRRCGGEWFYLQGRCRSCSTEYHRKYTPQHLEAVRSNKRASIARGRRDPVRARRILDNDLRSAFGITVDDYDRRVFEQGGACAICRSVPSIGMAKSGVRRKTSRLCVDHDHTTGAVRGLLCHDCNVGIGFFKDSPEILNHAIAYLGRNRI